MAIDSTKIYIVMFSLIINSISLLVLDKLNIKKLFFYSAIGAINFAFFTLIMCVSYLKDILYKEEANWSDWVKLVLFGTWFVVSLLLVYGIFKKYTPLILCWMYYSILIFVFLSLDSILFVIDQLPLDNTEDEEGNGKGFNIEHRFVIDILLAFSVIILDMILHALIADIKEENCNTMPDVELKPVDTDEYTSQIN